MWRGGTKPADYLHCIAHIEEPDQQVGQAIALQQQSGFSNRIKIAFNEWNLRGWHHPDFPGDGADQLEKIRERDESDRNET